MIDAIVEIAQLRVLPNSHPGCLNKLIAQPRISRAGDSSSSDRLSGGALRGDQSQKRSQLPDMAQVSPVAYSCQKLGACRSADSRNRYQVLKASLNLRVLMAEPEDFPGCILNLCLCEA